MREGRKTLSELNVMIIDDEPLALERMKRLLGGLTAEDIDIRQVMPFSDPMLALEAASREKIHIAFIDIEMPEVDGFELAEKLLQLHPYLHIIFVSAYQQYAVKAFDVNALDYLMKPVNQERLNVALRRAVETNKWTSVSSGKKPAMVCCLKYIRYLDSTGNLQEFPWRTYKAAELFAYLIHHRGKTVGKQEMIDLLWPEYDMKRATAQLYTAVYQIRKMIDSTELDLQIKYAERGYRLVWGSVKLDVEEWENSIRQAPPVTSETISLHIDLIRQYPGDYMEEHQYGWADFEQYRIRFLWLKHVRNVADCCLSLRDYKQAEELYRQIIDRVPDAEDGYFGLMRIYAELNYDSEVRKWFDQVSSKLKEELDIDPSFELSDWYRRWSESKQAIQERRELG